MSDVTRIDMEDSRPTHVWMRGSASDDAGGRVGHIEMDAATFRLWYVIRRRTRMHTAWRIVIAVSLVLSVAGAAIRLVIGEPPTWATVLGALWWASTVGWLYDDHCRRRFDRAMRDAKGLEE